MSLGALDGLKRGSSRLDFLKQTLQPEVPAGGRRGSLAGIGKAVPPPKGSISFTVSWLPDGGVWRPPSSGDLRPPNPNPDPSPDPDPDPDPDPVPTPDQVGGGDLYSLLEAKHQLPEHWVQVTLTLAPGPALTLTRTLILTRTLTLARARTQTLSLL